jgi:hypothetical protein
MRRVECTNLDALWVPIPIMVMRIKELYHLFHGRGIHGIWIENSLIRSQRDPNKSGDEGCIYPDSHASDSGLKSETIISILDYLHVGIKVLDKTQVH